MAGGEESPKWSQRIRRVALATGFALVLLIPKALGLRKRRAVWNSVRAAAFVLGLWLALKSWRGDVGWMGGAAGILLALASTAAGPIQRKKSVDEVARELGAVVVVNGGRFQRPSGKERRANLYVGRERIHALDMKGKALAEMRTQDIKALDVRAGERGWILTIGANPTQYTFRFEGVFGEHLARVAERSIASQVRRELPVLP